ncbi:MerR family transcriptional regulator [Paludicola sp. MB14-C6]|uniref:MerR family transcriptional regulator n=1 Tax=Paludihabitans sp. MB14-C6 TaxID=3070656 RepID=UPI0027DBF9FB|nr:MerR family transcriptional regulator [Paludicola sp. MB14-C6]WMJ24080.1 MerR family transcriptional regulator [Paludicola sp. MB14-C6]
MKEFFSPAEFAKLHGISKQSLLFYDKIGLFQPNTTDEHNGYRYYSVDQLEQLDTILMLKEIGVPLKEMKQYLQHRTTNEAISLLVKQKNELMQKIHNQKRIATRLDKKLQMLKGIKELNVSDGIEVSYYEEQYLYEVDVEPPYSEFNVNVAVKKLANEVTQKGLYYNYQIGVNVMMDDILQGQFLKPQRVYTILDEWIPDSHVRKSNAGYYAIIYHKGAYREAANSYQKLLYWIENNGYEICSDSYELCIVDNLTSGNEKDYLTEISIQVRNKNE